MVEQAEEPGAPKRGFSALSHRSKAVVRRVIPDGAAVWPFERRLGVVEGDCLNLDIR